MNIETYLKQPLEFDREIDRYLDSHSKLIIFEIGACEGEDTIKLRQKFPASEIYAFEALPKNVERMKSNYRSFQIDDIQIFELALSDKDSYADFYVSSGQPEGIKLTKSWDYGNKSSSLLPPKEHKKIHSWIKFDNKIRVHTQTVQSFCQSHNIDCIDFVYLDVQGAEIKVLQGAGSMINKIKVVWLEVESIELYNHQPLKKDVEIFMRKFNFTLVKDTVGEVTGDQLYVRKDLV
jgi:FkbM family methyltransferase